MKKLLNVLLVMIFMSLVIPRNLNAGDSIQIQVSPKSANIWFFHYGKKLTWYVMEIWPKGFILTKIGPPSFKLSKSVSLTIAAGPDFSAGGENLFQSFTLDVVPVISKNSLLGIFVNEVGVNKEGKTIYLFRHSLTLKNIGLRWKGFGVFGEKNEHLQIGPMIRYFASKKLSVEAWFAVNPHNGEKMIELSIGIGL